MAMGSPEPRPLDIIESIELISQDMAGVSLEAFEGDLRKRRLVERCIEIISEASRHLDDAVIARDPAIPWRKVAGIGNVLRHEYESVAPHIIWHAVQDDLGALGAACRQEIDRLRATP
jgi:uncharacterized protein with HEPN domain